MKKSKVIFTKADIEDFAKPISNELVTNAVNNANNLIYTVMNDVKNRVASLTSYDSIMVNEFVSKAITNNSSFDVILQLKSSEVKLETEKKQKINFKNILLNFFKSFKISFRKKKKKKIDVEKNLQKIDMNNLTYFKLKDMLFLLFIKYSPSNITLKNNLYCISLEDTKSGNLPINIYVAIKNDANSCILYKKTKSRSIQKTEIDFKNRFVNLAQLSYDTNSKSMQMIKILNCIYNYLYSFTPNQIYIESLVYNCPVQLFNSTNNVYDTFVALINYLDNLNIKEIKSIVNNNILLWDDKLCNINCINHQSFIKKIKSII